MPAETEFKLRAERPVEVAAIDASLREAGVESLPGLRRLHVDVYLDDDRRSLTRAGIGLRLRHATDRGVLCCKLRGTSTGGLFVRPEHEADWLRREAPRRAAELPAAVRAQVEPFVLDRPLTSVLRIETQRELRHVRAHEQELCELAIDHVEASGGGRSTTFFEIELEVAEDLPGNEQLAGRLLQTLPLHPADDDKPTHAAVRLGLPWPALPAAPNAEDPTTPALAALLELHLFVAREAERLVREDDRPEPLHAWRLALRRLRALVRAFESAWTAPTAAWLRERLTRTGRRLGTVRDLDVQLEALPSRAASLPRPLQASLPELQAWLEQERASSRHELMTWMGSEARLAQEAEFESRLLDLPRTGQPAIPFAAASKQAIAQAARRTRKRLRAIDFADAGWPVHDLRIAGRDLRFLVELLPDEAAHDPAKTDLRLLAMLRSLGDVRDHELGSTHVLALLQRVQGQEPRAPLLAACLGGLATHHETLAKKARKLARRLVEGFDRKRHWRRFGVVKPTT